MTRRSRHLAAVTVRLAAGLVAACALALPAAAARAATGSPAIGGTATVSAATGSYAPNPHEWWFGKWGVQQKVWPVTEGSGVTVGVVDSGVQASLPDLRGTVEPGGDMLGDPGNGEHDYKSNGGHGTEMAELIAGQGIGTTPVGAAPVGIAPRAKILPVHVIYPSTSSTTPIAQGIKYAVDHGADVINLSIGGHAPSPTTCDPAEQEAVAYALAHNVVVVAGSGDTNKTGPGPSDPGTCNGALTVGGVEPDGSLWKDSVQDPQVSVAAPGDHMYAVSDTGQQYSTDSSGTSGSSALVSGAAALIRSKYPKMPWYQVDQRLIGTAIPDGPRPNNGTGYGIIDVSRALNASAYPLSVSSPDPPYARYQSWLKTPAGQSFARANHIATGNSSPGNSGSGKSRAGSRPGSSAGGTSSGGSSTPIIIGVIVAAVIAIIVAAIVLATRKRPGGPGGPGDPGAPGGYQPGAYPPPGAYPQYPPPGPPQYPPPGQYPPCRCTS